MSDHSAHNRPELRQHRPPKKEKNWQTWRDHGSIQTIGRISIGDFRCMVFPARNCADRLDHPPAVFCEPISYRLPPSCPCYLHLTPRLAFVHSPLPQSRFSQPCHAQRPFRPNLLSCHHSANGVIKRAKLCHQPTTGLPHSSPKMAWTKMSGTTGKQRSDACLSSLPVMRSAYWKPARTGGKRSGPGGFGSMQGAEEKGYREGWLISETSCSLLLTRARDLCSETLELIQKTHPVDKTLPSEAVQAALFAGDVTRVSGKTWTDILLPLKLIRASVALSSLCNNRI